MELWEAITLLGIGMWTGFLLIGGYAEISRESRAGHKERTWR